MKLVILGFLIATAAVMGQDAPAETRSGTFVVGAKLGIPQASAVKNAAFSADTSDERVQTLANGSHIRTVTTGKLYRDAQGRERRETNTIVRRSPSGEEQTRVHVSITDPVAGVHWELDPERRVAQKHPAPMAEPVAAPAGQPLASSASKMAVAIPDAGNIRSEKLGTQLIEGMECQGRRVTLTIPAGSMGNDADIETVTENWISPQLQITVLSTRHDPRTADSTHKLLNIQLGDPAPELFEVPADYRIVELPPPTIVQTR